MQNILLVGCGNMGGAMLSRWQEKLSANYNFLVISPSHDAGGVSYKSLADLPASYSLDIIIFAVKPQMLAEIFPEYKSRFSEVPIYISIAAGKTIEFFKEHLGKDAKIIRTMPNTPAMVGKAVTALCASENVLAAERNIASELMNAVGSTIWVQESEMNAVTAISGSGPAYLFLFLESLTKAAENLGFSSEVAKKLALATVHGSVHLAEKSGESLEQLRKNVTSKGGTTEAALNILMQDNALENLINNAVQAAVKRASELE